VLIIEHNLDVIKSADWVIDLGPEGGDAGGYLVATGTPEHIAANPASITGDFLKRFCKWCSRVAMKECSQLKAVPRFFSRGSGERV
jgi:excinuclease ABC subunit A